MVWDKEVLAFARIGESAVVDSIPLADVKSVNKVDKPPASGSSSAQARHASVRPSGSVKTMPSEAGPGVPVVVAAAASGPRTRIVEVRVLAAQNLPIMDAFGTCDPFCRIALCGETRETTVRPARPLPIFH